MTTTTTTNIDRSIEQFCSNFISMGINFSSWGAPTIEFEMLASNNATTSGSSALNSAQSILSQYFPFITTSNFKLAHREIKKSSSGKIIAERWVDRFWWNANGRHVGLWRTVGGDIEIGSEYHSVTGIYGQNRSIPKNYTMSDNFLRQHHRSLRTGMCAWEWPQGSPFCKCNGFDDEEELNNWRRAPGLENPEITLGEIYYTWDEFLRSSGIMNESVKVITNNGIPVSANSALMRGMATGVFNTTGSYYSVINSIVNTFGWTYVPSCALGGHAFINPTGDFGKINVLRDAGVEIPDNAIASSEIKDYTAGYVQGSKLSIKRPGREQDVEIPDASELNSNVNYCAHWETDGPGDEALTTVDVIKKIVSQGSEIDAADCIWSFVSDYPIFYELGLALWLEEYGAEAVDDQLSWLQGIYDKVPSNYKFWTKADGIINVDPIKQLGILWHDAPVPYFGEFVKGTMTDAIKKAQADISVSAKVDALLTNVNRFAFTDEAENLPLSMSGDVYNPNGPNQRKLEDMTASQKFYEAAGWSKGSPDTFSFSHYGTQKYDFGQKTWSSSGGQVGYLDLSSDDSIGASPFADFKQFGYGKVTEFLDIYIESRNSTSGLSDDLGQDTGIIIVDQGPNTISTFGEGGYGIAGKEIFLDQNPSLEGGLGIIGAANISALKSTASGLISEVRTKLAEGTAGNNRTSKVYWHGFPSELCWNSQEDEALRADNEQTEEDVSEKATEACSAYDEDKWEINPKSRVLKGSYPITTHPNKKLHTFNVQWSLANDEETLYYMDPEQRAQQLAYKATKSVHVPYLDKISFSLVNDFYDLTGKSHLLENATINVVDGKLTTSYTFSQKVQSPDFAGVFGGKVAFQNLIR